MPTVDVSLWSGSSDYIASIALGTKYVTDAGYKDIGRE